MQRIDLYNKSRVMGDYQARFCERLKGKLLRPTRRFLRYGAVYPLLETVLIFERFLKLKVQAV